VFFLISYHFKEYEAMLKLEYFVPDDFEQLIKWIDNEALLINWSGSLFSFPLTQKSMSWYIENVNDIVNSETFIYKAIDTETDQVVGHISLGSISKKNRSGRISRVLIGGINNRGKGFCKSMAKAILKIGFEDLQLHRIDLGVYSFNTNAIECYKKSGMVIEGISRDILFYKNEWWSLVEMSILEDDWKKLQS